MPFILASNGMQIFDRGDHLTIIYRLNHQIRIVRMNASTRRNLCRHTMAISSVIMRAILW